MAKREEETAPPPPAEFWPVSPPAPVFTEGPDVYRMAGMPRGHCIIINNYDFKDKEKTRRGGDVDVRNMQKLFQTFHFDVRININLPQAVMKAVLSEAAKAQCERYDCLVVIIMSRGTDGKIEGVDGGHLDLMEDVYSLFNNENCPQLKGKPKVFFIQACRIGHVNNETAAVGESVDAVSIGQELLCPRNIPIWADMFLAYATIPGHLAYRNNIEGSSFISSLYEVFCREASTGHLEKLMQAVTKNVMERRQEGPYGSQQTVSITMFGWSKSCISIVATSGSSVRSSMRVSNRYRKMGMK